VIESKYITHSYILSFRVNSKIKVDQLG
jgi:hypothetical protein